MNETIENIQKCSDATQTCKVTHLSEQIPFYIEFLE